MSQSKKKRIEVGEVGDVAVVEFIDKRILDEQNIQLIGEQLFDLVDNQNKRSILLNFSNVEYLSSAALGRLMSLHKKLQAVSGQLKLCNIKSNIEEAFKITKLDKILKIYPSEEAALEAFG